MQFSFSNEATLHTSGLSINLINFSGNEYPRLFREQEGKYVWFAAIVSRRVLDHLAAVRHWWATTTGFLKQFVRDGLLRSISRLNCMSFLLWVHKLLLIVGFYGRRYRHYIYHTWWQDVFYDLGPSFVLYRDPFRGPRGTKTIAAKLSSYTTHSGFRSDTWPVLSLIQS